MRERRMGGNDRCEKGHVYPSSTALFEPPPSPSLVGVAYGSIEMKARSMRNEPEATRDIKRMGEAILSDLDIILTELRRLQKVEKAFQSAIEEGEDLSDPDWHPELDGE
jgi:hypothetical protein